MNSGASRGAVKAIIKTTLYIRVEPPVEPTTHADLYDQDSDGCFSYQTGQMFRDRNRLMECKTGKIGKQGEIEKRQGDKETRRQGEDTNCLCLLVSLSPCLF